MINIYNSNNETLSRIIRLAEKAADIFFGFDGKTEIDLSFVSPEEIRELNKENRNVDSVTDILSFPSVDKVVFPIKPEDYPYDYDKQTNRLFLGDLAVCFERITEQASEYGNTIERELAYLTIHGILHLLGYDHIDENDKKIMREKEEEIYSSIIWNE